MKPIRYVLIDPAKQTIEERRGRIGCKSLKSIIGCSQFEACGLSQRHFLWFDGDVIPSGMPLDSFVLEGIVVPGSRAVITGPDIGEEGSSDCLFAVEAVRSVIQWAPQRRIIGERVVETPYGCRVELIWEPPLAA